MSQFEAKVIDLSPDGLGVLKNPEGIIFFVPGVWPGDEGVFEVVERKKKNYGFAKLIKLKVQSEDRIEAPCQYHGFDEKSCGGCAWQFVSYEAQTKWKQLLLGNSLKRAGFEKFQSRVETIVESPKQLGYRNRVMMKTDGQELGFFAFRSKELVPINDCLVLSDVNRNTLKDLVAKLPRKDWEPQPRRKWMSVEFDEQIEAAEVNVDQAIEFKQANDEQNNAMKRWLSSELESFSLDAPVVELFCGNGNFTEVFASKGFEQVSAVELSKESVEVAAEKFPQYYFSALNLFEQKNWKRLNKSFKDAEILFLDPPREGFPQLPNLMEVMPSLQTIYYVSCNFSTFFRDVNPLLNSNWQIDRLQPFDFFPQTPHLEIVSKFTLV